MNFELSSLPDRQIFRNLFYLSRDTNIKNLCKGSDAPRSDPLHKVMRYWFYCSTQFAFSFSPDQNGRLKMFCTTKVPALEGRIGGAGP